ncbi:unnamed protein product [Pylaiella littoralis]
MRRMSTATPLFTSPPPTMMSSSSVRFCTGGACVNASSSEGQDPLHVAIENDRIAVAETLLKAGADPNARYGQVHQKSPLQLARSSLAMIRTLLKYGADAKSSDGFGYTALHWAVNASGAHAEVGVINALVEAGASLEAQTAGVRFSINYDSKGMTPLHVAVYLRKSGAMVALLRKGANINAKDLQGLTPLHVLCKTSAKPDPAEAADLLLRQGADETATDNDGKTPGELIEEDADLTGRLAGLLNNAPADRTWRRRGMLILCRTSADKVQGEDREGRASKLLCSGMGVQSGVAAVGRGQGIGRLLAKVVKLEDDAVFRMIVGFL